MSHRPSLEEADVIQNQVVAQDFIGKRGSAVNVRLPPRSPHTFSWVCVGRGGLHGAALVMLCG